MKIIKAKEGQYSGVPLRWNVKEGREQIPIPEGEYIVDGDWFYLALRDSMGNPHQSVKHAYIGVKKTK